MLTQPYSTRTKRQLQILAMCAQGSSREEIGRQMHLSPWTIKRDLDRLRETLEAADVTHALCLCIVRGYLVLDEDLGEIVPASVPESQLLEMAAA